jgi:hypothetical protein
MISGSIIGSINAVPEMEDIKMIRAGGTRKVSVTLPDDLVEQVRVHVKAGEFSSFCAVALRNHLAHYRQRHGLTHSFGIWKDEDHPDLSSSKDASGYVRKLRKSDGKRLARLLDK